MNKHQPERWRAFRDFNSGWCVAHGKKVVAYCNDEATARRIAQWPVMLEALKAVQRIIGQDGATMAEQTAVLRMMREAIAAAEGDAK